jgi:hypothetical protein
MLRAVYDRELYRLSESRSGATNVAELSADPYAASSPLGGFFLFGNRSNWTWSRPNESRTLSGYSVGYVESLFLGRPSAFFGQATDVSPGNFVTHSDIGSAPSSTSALSISEGTLEALGAASAFDMAASIKNGWMQDMCEEAKATVSLTTCLFENKGEGFGYTEAD